MSEWSTKQLAMELVARGLGPSHAVATARAFERAWRPEQARLDAEREAWSKRFDAARAEKVDQLPKEKQLEWALEAGRIVRAAGEAAAQLVLDSEGA